MFADRAKIFIRSGKGGDGHVSFRRELYVPDGGPDGGDGGDGGDVIFVVDPGLNTLTDFRHVRKYVAQDGEEGGKRNCHGANGNDIILKVRKGCRNWKSNSGYVEQDRACDAAKRRQRRQRKPSVCDIGHAGTKVCTAGKTGERALGNLRA